MQLEGYHYNTRALAIGDGIATRLGNEEAHADEGNTDSYSSLKSAIFDHRYTIGALFTKNGDFQDHMYATVVHRVLAAYQYAGLKHKLDLPGRTAPPEEVRDALTKILTTESMAHQFGENLYRYRMVNRPARYNYLPLMKNLQGIPLVINDFGGASGLGPAFLETQYGKALIKGKAEDLGVPVPPPLDIRTATVIDIQPNDDLWMMACSLPLDQPHHPLAMQISQAKAVRDANPDKYKRITGNIFEIMDTPLHPLKFYSLRKNSNVAITSFVRYFMDHAFPEEAWSEVIGKTLNNGGWWFDIDKTTCNHRGEFPIRLFQKINNKMVYQDDVARLGTDQESIIWWNENYIK